MKVRNVILAVAALAATSSSLLATSAFAQAKEQFVPVLSYRTGAYAPNGVPWANGYVDYLKLVNARGGINGVKISFEECETGYDTARSVECYERLKDKNGGASFVQPLSTGATFAITEKAPADKVPVVTVGYGRSESADGSIFKWNFPIAGTYWVAADTILQAISKKEGGWDKLKGKHGGASMVQPLSTGATFAITEKAPIDKVPVVTVGYGRSESADGSVFKWNFPIAGTYWVASDTILQAIAKKEGGGMDKLKGKKIALVYHDSPFGKEPIPLMQERSNMHGYELQLLPVAAPGVEQKSTWLQIRQSRPDYVVLWGWGVMNTTAIKEAQATGYPREKMYGVWWAGAEPDVKDVADGAKGYNAVTLQHGADMNAKVVKEVLASLHDKGQGTGPKEEVGQVLYLRGAMSAMLGIEGIRAAQERYGKGKVMTGEQVRWGLENLNLTQAKLDGLGFAGVMRPISTSCADHMGASWARIHTWDGKQWKFTSDWLQADDQVIKPLVKATAAKYAADKKLTPRTPADCQS